VNLSGRRHFVAKVGERRSQKLLQISPCSRGASRSNPVSPSDFLRIALREGGTTV
jgi:hypothetical protein